MTDEPTDEQTKAMDDLADYAARYAGDLAPQQQEKAA